MRDTRQEEFPIDREVMTPEGLGTVTGYGGENRVNVKVGRSVASYRKENLSRGVDLTAAASEADPFTNESGD